MHIQLHSAHPHSRPCSWINSFVQNMCKLHRTKLLQHCLLTNNFHSISIYDINKTGQTMPPFTNNANLYAFNYDDIDGDSWLCHTSAVYYVNITRFFYLIFLLFHPFFTLLRFFRIACPFSFVYLYVCVYMEYKMSCHILLLTGALAFLSIIIVMGQFSFLACSCTSALPPCLKLIIQFNSNRCESDQSATSSHIQQSTILECGTQMKRVARKKYNQDIGRWQVDVFNVA